MKTMTIICTFLCLGLLFSNCKKDEEVENATKTEGTLEFKTSNSVIKRTKSLLTTNSRAVNPALVGDTTETHSTSLKLCIGDVWVSKGEVKAGEADDLEWIKLTSVTNTEAKLFEDYTFTAKEVPVGSYKSVKITFRNVFYRYAQLISDPTVSYELLETMGSWTTPCDENDITWAPTNYFGPAGNHRLNENDVFELQSEGEKIAGFDIEPNRKAIVTWRLGAGVTTPCITYLIDANKNRKWDCGTDRMDFNCPPEVKYMWDFVITYE